MTDSETPRTQGQDLGTTGPTFVVPETPRLGHKSDSDSFARSRNKSYKKKITQQKARTK